MWSSAAHGHSSINLQNRKKICDSKILRWEFSLFWEILSLHSCFHWHTLKNNRLTCKTSSIVHQGSCWTICNNLSTTGVPSPVYRNISWASNGIHTTASHPLKQLKPGQQPNYEFSKKISIIVYNTNIFHSCSLKWWNYGKKHTVSICRTLGNIVEGLWMLCSGVVQEGIYKAHRWFALRCCELYFLQSICTWVNRMLFIRATNPPQIGALALVPPTIWDSPPTIIPTFTPVWMRHSIFLTNRWKKHPVMLCLICWRKIQVGGWDCYSNRLERQPVGIWAGNRYLELDQVFAIGQSSLKPPLLNAAPISSSGLVNWVLPTSVMYEEDGKGNSKRSQLFVQPEILRTAS